MAISMKVARVRVDDNHVPKLEFEKLLRVVGTFSIEIDRSELLREAEFPFVEFATQLSAWLASGCVSGFDYVSMESDDRSLVYFRPQDSRWEVRAMLGQRGKLGVVSADELRDAVSKFLLSVPFFADEVGVDVRELIVARATSDASNDGVDGDTELDDSEKR